MHIHCVRDDSKSEITKCFSQSEIVMLCLTKFNKNKIKADKKKIIGSSQKHNTQ